ncbi:Roundabout 1 [Liparis tanakae]|uniref:Roundabout 1 n=1 Tax=Liparis tanakae TaxID=230148 RepID=A0A4Z2GDQ5_9TELE|nr:Roundabout 1 [Liparis tanakae]
MRVGAWLLWVSWFCTWAEFSQRGECHDACPTESGPDGGSRSRVKEHVRHGVGHQHTPHRSRPHRRKVLQEEFSLQPSDVEVAEGEVAVLNCGPPIGHPEPNIIWKKNGLAIDTTDHHYTELSGKLIIAPAEKKHSGAYVCVASNTGGVRESRAARLSVLAKPALVLKPDDVSVRTGESAQFYCQAKGDPPPAVAWSREQGPLPNGRYLVNPDHTLQIHYVTAQDAGKYTCTAVNDAGVVTASAQLLVEGLRRLASEDLIIKHRMAAPDSPWISGGWRPAFNQQYQDLWAHGQKHPGLRGTSLPTSWKDLGRVDSSVPIVTDSCGVYGTFYMDLMGSGLQTFNSPRCGPKMSHGPPHQQGAETIQIFPVGKTPPLGSMEALPWKQAIRPQPKMGVLRESWDKSHSKQELHAVNSVPIAPTRNQAKCDQVSGCPRLLHYSASLHLVDMLPPPPPLPMEDTQSFSSDEGSSRSTGVMSSSSVDGGQGGTLTAQEAAVYLERGAKPERCSALPEQRPSLPCPFSPGLGYACGPVRSDGGEPEYPPVGLRRARLQSAPSSCCSEWDSLLWNTWSSAADGDVASARSSLISSVDSCSTTDSAHLHHLRHLARLLAAARAEETASGASLSDFSPPASPLSASYPSFRAADGDSLGEPEPVPAWDWSSAWVEDMEARCRAHYTGGEY